MSIGLQISGADEIRSRACIEEVNLINSAVPALPACGRERRSFLEKMEVHGEVDNQCALQAQTAYQMTYIL